MEKEKVERLLKEKEKEKAKAKAKPKVKPPNRSRGAAGRGGGESDEMMNRRPRRKATDKVAKTK